MWLRKVPWVPQLERTVHPYHHYLPITYVFRIPSALHPPFLFVVASCHSSHSWVHLAVADLYHLSFIRSRWLSHCIVNVIYYNFFFFLLLVELYVPVIVSSPPWQHTQKKM